jgi:hypothetical protein
MLLVVVEPLTPVIGVGIKLDNSGPVRRRAIVEPSQAA